MSLNLCEHTTELVVCDSETLDRWDDAIVLSAAFVYGDFKKDISFEELVDTAFFMKFDAREQRYMGRKMDQGTVDWWRSQKVDEAARKVSLYPSPDDRSVTEFVKEYNIWAHKKLFEPKNVIHTDRNLFDLRKLQHIIEVNLRQKEPWDYHNIIDVTSTLRAWGADRYAGVDARTFPGMTYHDPRCDVALDWLRLRQTAIAAGLL